MSDLCNKSDKIINFLITVVYFSTTTENQLKKYGDYITILLSLILAIEKLPKSPNFRMLFNFLISLFGEISPEKNVFLNTEKKKARLLPTLAAFLSFLLLQVRSPAHVTANHCN
jgi:hypothetical protein